MSILKRVRRADHGGLKDLKQRWIVSRNSTKIRASSGSKERLLHQRRAEIGSAPPGGKDEGETDPVFCQDFSYFRERKREKIRPLFPPIPTRA